MRKILLFMSFLCLQMQAQQVEELLGAFERRPDAAAANAFFSELQQSGFLDEPLTFASGTPADSLRQQVCYWAAEWYYDRQQYELVLRYGADALPLYHGGNDEKADCLNLLAMAAVRQGNMAQAADYAKECLTIDLRSGDDDRISSSMNTVAGIYMAGYQAQEAEQYILGALEHSAKVDNPARRAVILGMASEIYHTLGDDSQALTYASEAYSLDSLLGRQPQAAIRLSQKGSALLGLHRYTEAEALFRLVIPQLRQCGDLHSMAIAQNRLGMALLCQERQREAIPYYKEAATLFSQMGDLYNEVHSHRGLYESYWTLNPDSAKIELDRFDLLKDSLYSHSSAEALSRYNAELGNDRLRQENDQVRSTQRRTVVFAVVLVLLLALAAWLVIRSLRRRHRRQMQELVQRIELLSGAMPHAASSTDQPTETPKAEQAAQTEADEPCGEAAEVVSAEDRQFLISVIEVVNMAMGSGHFGVEQIASEMNMSVQTFRRRLQLAAGESPKAYIQAIQMERAARLLTDTPQMTVTQVARRCGFDDASTFAHTFRRVYGCSPTQYRDEAASQDVV